VQGDEVVVEFLIVDPDQLDKEAAEAEKFATEKRQLAEWDGNHQDPTEEELVERQRLMYLSTPKTYGDIETAVQALQEWDAAHEDSDALDRSRNVPSDRSCDAAVSGDVVVCRATSWVAKWVEAKETIHVCKTVSQPLPNH
jgi:hypothetical protein